MSNLSDNQTATAIKPLRVLVATLFLFVIANVAFALIDPPVEDLMLFNRVFPGFRRFPRPRIAREENGKVTFSGPGIRDLNFLFPSHIISAGDKSLDEYRIILIGDSSAWGANLQLEETMAEQINQAHLRACDNDRIVVYNLSFPGVSGVKDLMLLSESVKSYNPDLMIWSFTMNTFLRTRRGFAAVYENSVNYERILDLERSSGYNFGSKKIKPGEATLVERTIYGRREELNLLLQLYLYDLKSLSIATDEPETQTTDEFTLRPGGG